MELGELQNKLLAAGRLEPRDERVPYAFEKRITARLAKNAAPETLAWAHDLWRAAVSCTALALLLVSWSVLTPGNSLPTGDFADDLEKTVLAAADAEHSFDSTW